jgi:hypothetical protein
MVCLSDEHIAIMGKYLNSFKFIKAISKYKVLKFIYFTGMAITGMVLYYPMASFIFPNF